MRIDIYSDTVCPWCFLGMRRFEQALAQRPQYRPDVTFRAFELHPDISWDGMAREGYLADKLGGGVRLAALERSWEQQGEALGLTFRFDLIQRVPNTRRSHLLIWHAGRRGLQAQAMERIMRAYFQQGCDIGDVEELVRLGVELGLPEHETRRALILREGQDGVVAAQRHANALGIAAVPTLVFNGQYTLSGAQTPAILARTLDQVIGLTTARAATVP